MHFSTFRVSALAISVVGPLAMALHPASAEGPVSQAAADWSAEIWQASLDGADDAVTTLLQQAPTEGISPSALGSYRASLARWAGNRLADEAAVKTRREAAWAEMLELIEEDDLLEAMSRLAEVQMLSASVGEPLQRPESVALLKKLRGRVDQWKADKQLLPAQEGVFLLKMAWEDVGDEARETALQEELTTLRKKMLLLRRYAFAAYHEKLRAHAKSKGETINAEYSPRLVDRWTEEVAGIDLQMAVESLLLAESEHVERIPVRDMLDGGLASIRNLVTAPGLEATFEGLSDPARVVAFLAAIDASAAALDVPANAIDARAVITRLMEANEASIGFPEQVILREFVDGATDELDRFSGMIWPFDAEQFKRQMEGKFVGVGIQIQESEVGEVVVVSPLEGKPAFFAGVQPDDVIAEVDGQSTAGWTVHDAVRHITGPKDTTVVLGLRREGELELVYVPIVRDVIRMPTVKGWSKEAPSESGEEDWNFLIDPDLRIGYIKLTGFDKQTYRDIRAALAQMYQDGMVNGIVLDLRHNPGGLLDVAASISNLWVSEGTIVSGEDRDGDRTFLMAARSRFCYLGGMPTAVLVNQGSASASEIVAGCLQAHRAAVIIGDRSFGKGSVQTVHGVGPEAHIKVTSQYYRLPSIDGITPGRLVHRRPGSDDWGVVPDLIVEMSPDDIEASHRLRVRAEAAASSLPWARARAKEAEAEDGPADIERLINDGFDPQLELALLILQSQALAETAPTEEELVHLVDRADRGAATGTSAR
jgi:carboxyl-terminal processing protease